jgi:hypothetical protein
MLCNEEFGDIKTMMGTFYSHLILFIEKKPIESLENDLQYSVSGILEQNTICYAYS